MALWKETMANEQSERSEAEPLVPAVSPAPQRKENVTKGHESVFGSGVTIEGKIEGDADVRIAGKFKGDIQIKGNLNIEKGARLAAKIKAETVIIEGEVDGNVAANAQIKLMESGQVIGDLKAATLTVTAGARMRGNVEFGWSEAESAKIANIRAPEKAKSGVA